ncbi:hypothetical protein IQ06DRAFT_296081 [Phaeosphaeriaceae sp. SRC1lsM3a]|nr:hypothetical protein IQ06DRAFT_296081 [Stagonospora sp. SRC1lsM3a]
MYFSVYSLSLFALILSATTISAAPAPDTTSADEAPFTFSSWIDGILADPNGNHLSPHEAVAAANRTAARLGKRAICDDQANHFQPANVRFLSVPYHKTCVNVSTQADDASWCLRYIADLHAKGIRCGIGANQFMNNICKHGNAIVTSSKSDPSGQGYSW